MPLSDIGPYISQSVCGPSEESGNFRVKCCWAIMCCYCCGLCGRGELDEDKIENSEGEKHLTKMGQHALGTLRAVPRNSMESTNGIHADSMAAVEIER